MKRKLNHKAVAMKHSNTTFESKIDFNKFVHIAALEHNEAEKEVLTNINKIEFMRFLGLKDSQGRIIHFGDILIDEHKNLLTPVCEISNGEHVLFFKPIHLLNKNIPIGCKSTYSETLTVIGNIYKNSELFYGLKIQNTFTKIKLTTSQKNIYTTTIHIEFKKYCKLKQNLESV